jgi:hypothetical protein
MLEKGHSGTGTICLSQNTIYLFLIEYVFKLKNFLIMQEDIEE